MNFAALVTAWTPTASLSPLVLDAWELGESYVTRKVGQAGFTLNSLSLCGPLTFPTLEAAQAAGAKIEAAQFARKLSAQQDEPFEDVGEPTQDLLVNDQGSIVLFTPLSAHAQAWIADNVQDDAQWFGRSLAVEHRYAPYLIEGMVGAGLTTSSVH